MRWRFSIVGTAAATLLLFLLYLFAGDPALWVLFLVIPSVAVLVLVVLVLFVFRRTRRLSFELLVGTVFFATAMTAGWHFEATLRPTLRWAFFSHRFKAEVLAQPSDPSGKFKHVEWDGWGGAPVGDWSAYVVFDPRDSLDADLGLHPPRMIRGIPCDVLRVQRLQRYWYSITLQMNQWWEGCEQTGSAPTPK